MKDQYHHGDLRRTLLGFAADMAAEGSPEAITLRGLARRAGVSHSAPVHHFGTRKNLLTALAAEGFAELGDALAPHVHSVTHMGNAYVDWALGHPGHYAVMWQPRLIDEASREFTAARERAWSLLTEAVTTANGPQPPEDREAVSYAAFALVHGLADIWLSETLPRPVDPHLVTSRVTELLTISGPESPSCAGSGTTQA